MQGIVNEKKGNGFSIQGIIEQYQVASGGNISAGDFVEYINNQISLGSDTQINNSSYSGYTISAVALSDTKVFIAHNRSSSNYLNGVVCEISGTIITAGTDTQINTASMSGYTISAVALSDTKVFIAYNRSNSYYLNGIVCTISGTTITKGSDTQINNSTYSCSVISAVALSEDKVFIAHSYTRQTYLRGTLISISGTTITIIQTGIALMTIESQDSGTVISAVALSEDKVFIAHGSASKTSSYNKLFGMVCTISGTTITVGTDVQLSTTSYTGSVISAVALSNNKVFIAHSYSDSYYLYGMVCTIEGSTITAGTDTAINNTTAYLTSNQKVCPVSAVLLSNNTVFIAYATGTSASTLKLNCIMCNISDTTITPADDTAIISDVYSGYIISATLLNNNKIFIAHSMGTSTSTLKLYSILTSVNSGLYTIIEDTQTITGIAKTSGISGDTVQVYVPDL